MNHLIAAFLIVAVLSIGPLIFFVVIYRKNKRLKALALRIQSLQEEKMFTQRVLDNVLRGIVSEKVVVKGDGSLELSNFMSFKSLEKLYIVLENNHP